MEISDISDISTDVTDFTDSVKSVTSVLIPKVGKRRDPLHTCLLISRLGQCFKAEKGGVLSKIRGGLDLRLQNYQQSTGFIRISGKTAAAIRVREPLRKPMHLGYFLCMLLLTG